MHVSTIKMLGQPLLHFIMKDIGVHCYFAANFEAFSINSKKKYQRFVTFGGWKFENDSVTIDRGIYMFL